MPHKKKGKRKGKAPAHDAGNSKVKMLDDGVCVPSDKATNAKKCAACGDPAKSKCNRCGLAKYCSRDCQKKDWTTHRKVCKPKPAVTDSPDSGGVAHMLKVANAQRTAQHHTDAAAAGE